VVGSREIPGRALSKLSYRFVKTCLPANGRTAHHTCNNPTQFETCSPLVHLSHRITPPRMVHLPERPCSSVFPKLFRQPHSHLQLLIFFSSSSVMPSGTGDISGNVFFLMYQLCLLPLGILVARRRAFRSQSLFARAGCSHHELADRLQSRNLRGPCCSRFSRHACPIRPCAYRTNITNLTTPVSRVKSPSPDIPMASRLSLFTSTIELMY
jgi:hypothetical protein